MSTLGTSGKFEPFNPVKYGATIVLNASSNQPHKLTVTDTNGFTVAAPVDTPSNGALNLEILNSSGGSMGTITWASVFKLAGAFTNPANGKARTIVFMWDGTNWVETARAAADI